MRGWLPLITKMTWPPRASTRLSRSARECSASTVRHTPARSISSMTGPMTVVSFVLRSTPRWAALSRLPCQKNPRCWGASWPLTLAPRGFAVGAQAAQGGDVAGVAVGRGGQRRVRGGDRDAAEGGAGREFRASAGDGLRRGGDRGRGGFPLPPGGLAGLLVRQLAGSPLPPGGLAGPGLGLAGLVPAAFLQPWPGTGPRTRRPARPSSRTAGHRPGRDRTGPRPAGSSSPTGRRRPPPACAEGIRAPGVPAAGGSPPIPRPR